MGAAARRMWPPRPARRRSPRHGPPGGRRHTQLITGCDHDGGHAVEVGRPRRPPGATRPARPAKSGLWARWTPARPVSASSSGTAPVTTMTGPMRASTAASHHMPDKGSADAAPAACGSIRRTAFPRPPPARPQPWPVGSRRRGPPQGMSFWNPRQQNHPRSRSSGRQRHQAGPGVGPGHTGVEKSLAGHGQHIGHRIDPGGIGQPALHEVDGSLAGGEEHTREDADLNQRPGPLGLEAVEDPQAPERGSRPHADRGDRRRHQAGQALEAAAEQVHHGQDEHERDQRPGARVDRRAECQAGPTGPVPRACGRRSRSRDREPRRRRHPRQRTPLPGGSPTARPNWRNCPWDTRADWPGHRTFR